MLELPYEYHCIPHGSDKRDTWRHQYGHHLSLARRAMHVADTLAVIQVPFLLDPNTKTELLESADIVSYLYRTYKTGEMVDECFLDYSTKGASASHGTLGKLGASNKPAKPKEL